MKKASLKGLGGLYPFLKGFLLGVPILFCQDMFKWILRGESKICFDRFLLKACSGIPMLFKGLSSGPDPFENSFLGVTIPL